MCPCHVPGDAMRYFKGRLRTSIFPGPWAPSRERLAEGETPGPPPVGPESSTVQLTNEPASLLSSEDLKPLGKFYWSK